MQVGRRQTFTHLVLIIVVRLLSTIIQRSAGQPACADTRVELFSSKGEETTDDADWEEGGRCCQSEEQLGSGWQEPRDVSRRRSRSRRRRSSSGGAAAARLSTPTLLLSTSSSLGPAQKFPLPLSA